MPFSELSEEQRKILMIAAMDHLGNVTLDLATKPETFTIEMLRSARDAVKYLPDLIQQLDHGSISTDTVSLSDQMVRQIEKRLAQIETAA